MKHLSMMEKEGLLISVNDKPNAIAIPSIQKAKYLISLENRNVFLAGLNMLSSRSFKAFIAKKVLAVIYNLGLIKHLLKSNLVYIDKNNVLMTLIEQNYKKSIGVNIYLGAAKNQNFSLTLQVINPDKEYYLRYPISKMSKECAANELNNIIYLQKKGLNSFIQQFDKLIQVKNNKLYAYDGIPHNKTKSNLCCNKIKLLQMLTTNDYEQLKDNLFFKTLNSSIKNMLVELKNTPAGDINDIYEKTEEIVSVFFMKKAFFHGDFSPDNILISRNQFYLIDFEYSCNDFFSCFDLFHYCYKANKFHLKIITLKDIKFIDTYVKKIYGDYPFFCEFQLNKFEMLRYLFIFYLFLLLKRYYLDEKLSINDDVISKLQESIRMLSWESVDFK